MTTGGAWLLTVGIMKEAATTAIPANAPSRAHAATIILPTSFLGRSRCPKKCARSVGKRDIRFRDVHGLVYLSMSMCHSFAAGTHMFSNSRSMTVYHFFCRRVRRKPQKGGYDTYCSGAVYLHHSCARPPDASKRYPQTL